MHVVGIILFIHWDLPEVHCVKWGNYHVRIMLQIGNDDVNWRNTQTKVQLTTKCHKSLVQSYYYSHSAPIVLYDTIIMLLMPHNIQVLVLKHINIALIYTRILMQCLEWITNALFIIQNMCPNLSKLKRKKFLSAEMHSTQMRWEWYQVTWTGAHLIRSSKILSGSQHAEIYEEIRI